ncbi:hypothetical protein K2173_005377 [Erythroxylum novogranatense]|uniref:Uncharacterized protein n=1 Tax=Erythroxylum novogranatense TaxID=1862640 RepID=A0AAV8TBF3_9ROSI|nr:hypothetical protein K2173_005377 [Erythroxylum novogranatense]
MNQLGAQPNCCGQIVESPYEVCKDDRDVEQYEDEKEDLDFNPFLKGTPSPKASSSLGSRVEVFKSSSSKQNEVWNYSAGRKCKKNKSDFRFQVQNQTFDDERENGLTKNVNDGDNDDATCKHTRARYSLTSFTLDKLESLLQKKKDNEDNLHNVDDEEDYGKFLVAILQGGDGDGKSIRENENVDDEEEDNDVDFEIEFKELLESDVDDESKRPLCPLLPVYPGGGAVPFLLCSTEDCLVNGFTPQKIGKLHLFSLCIFDPSWQLIASQIQELIFEMLHKRDEVTTWKTLTYPDICFGPSKFSQNFSSSKGKENHALNGHMVSSQSTGSSWLPIVSSPIVSIIDVSFTQFIVHDYRQHMNSNFDAQYEKQPLFYLPNIPSLAYKLAQRFIPLFNPGLFPHKTPPAAVVKRILFTDVEDELLVLGMMEYNTYWKAIQQLVMKTSHLTLEEIERIEELYKLDWMFVWKFVVPHRNPSLLPHQWRIALGTQRSYKDNQVESKMEGNRSGDDCMGNANKAYVHQGFLADWRPSATSLLFSKLPCLDITTKDLPSKKLLTKGSHIKEQPKAYGPGGLQSLIDDIPSFSYASYYYHCLTAFDVTYVRHFPCNSTQNHQISDTRLNAWKSKIYFWPYQACRRDGACLVKLAPKLHPVNLPSSIHEIPLSVLKSNQSEMSIQMSASRSGNGEAIMEVKGPKLSYVTKLESIIRDTGESSLPEEATNSYAEESTVQYTSFIEERGNEAYFNMHPLLFQESEGSVPYFSLSFNNSGSSSFSLFSGNQPKLNLTKGPRATEFLSASYAIDFHPLFFNLHRGQNGNQFDSIQTAGSKPSTFTEKVNLGKIRQSRSTVDASILGNTMTSSETKNPYLIYNHNNLRAQSKPLLDVRMKSPTNNVGRCNLSDSDEEIEENVEFECEEMTDSDGEEGSGNEPTVVPGSAMGKTIIDPINDQQCQVRSSINDQDYTSILSKSSPFLRLSVIHTRKDRTPASCLSLDSCAPIAPESMKSKHDKEMDWREGGRGGECGIEFKFNSKFAYEKG